MSKLLKFIKQISFKRNMLIDRTTLGIRPSLFLIYVNMIFIVLPRSFCFLFLLMINTNLLYVDRDLELLGRVINMELQKVCDWLNVIKLTINAKKSNFVMLIPSQKNLSYLMNIRIHNNASNSDIFLECKDYVKFQGVLRINTLHAFNNYFNPNLPFSDLTSCYFFFIVFLIRTLK